MAGEKAPLNMLIVEDQFIEANNLQMIIERAGYAVCGIARSVPVALEIIRTTKPDLVLLDIFLKGKLTGIDLAALLRKENIAFIYLSANSNREVLEAAKATFPYGFLVKPFREKDVLVALEIAAYLHAHSLEALTREQQETLALPRKAEPQKRNSPANSSPEQYGITGNGTAVKKLWEHICIVAATDISVLITGESGTGKEKAADAIKQLSNRNDAPFIKVNCAAIPQELMESILFGHERGAFTGAAEMKKGKFEQAHTGTIFLDEIGELPLEAQSKLLRVLQEKEIERLGSNGPVKVDLRVLAATNRNLEQEMAAGRFRIDLYYRLNAFPLHMPPLRERKEDIPELVSQFLEIYGRKSGKFPLLITDKSLALLQDYHWPGNIRELEHIIERSVLLCKGNIIEGFDLMDVRSFTDSRPVKTMEEHEREHIGRVLALCKGKISGVGGAAEILGLPVSTLNSRMKKLGIRKKTF